MHSVSNGLFSFNTSSLTESTSSIPAKAGTSLTLNRLTAIHRIKNGEAFARKAEMV